jgi:hypothetical protein
MILMPVAAMSHVFEFLAAFLGLSAVLAVFVDGDSQIFFRFVNIALTPILCARGQGRTDQANQRQQGYAKNSDSTSHFASPFRTWN